MTLGFGSNHPPPKKKVISSSLHQVLSNSTLPVETSVMVKPCSCHGRAGEGNTAYRAACCPMGQLSTLPQRAGEPQLCSHFAFWMIPPGDGS